MSALYLRYRSKDELLRRLCSDGLQRYVAETQAALDDRGDAWTAYSNFMRRVVEADTHTVVLRLAGTFRPNKELYRAAEYAQELTLKLFKRVKAAGAIRSDVEVVDIALIFEQLAAVQIKSSRRTAQLRQRYLALFFDALRAPTAAPLPGPPPDWQDINSRWDS